MQFGVRGPYRIRQAHLHLASYRCHDRERHARRECQPLHVSTFSLPMTSSHHTTASNVSIPEASSAPDPPKYWYATPKSAAAGSAARPVTALKAPNPLPIRFGESFAT